MKGRSKEKLISPMLEGDNKLMEDVNMLAPIMGRFETTTMITTVVYIYFSPDKMVSK